MYMLQLLTYWLQKCTAWLFDKSLITWQVPSNSFSEPFAQHSMHYVEYLKTVNRSCHLFSRLRSCLFVHLCLWKFDLFALPWTHYSLFKSSSNCGTQTGQSTLGKWFSIIWATNCFMFMHPRMIFFFCFCAYIMFHFTHFPQNFTILDLRDWFLLSTCSIFPHCYCIASFIFSDSSFNLSLRIHIFP